MPIYINAFECEALYTLIEVHICQYWNVTLPVWNEAHCFSQLLWNNEPITDIDNNN